MKSKSKSSKTSGSSSERLPSRRYSDLHWFLTQLTTSFPPVYIIYIFGWVASNKQQMFSHRTIKNVPTNQTYLPRFDFHFSITPYILWFSSNSDFLKTFQ
jgi:hypothetical protein